jgi:hypothetical protein
VRQADCHRTGRAEIAGIANDGDIVRENPVERSVRREIIDDYDRIGWAGLTLQPCERLLIPISSPIGLVPALDVRRQAVPKAAQAGPQLPAMADRPDREAGCEEEGMDDASQRQAPSIRAVLVHPKIK